jgi:hypothetical protein
MEERAQMKFHPSPVLPLSFLLQPETVAEFQRLFYSLKEILHCQKTSTDIMHPVRKALIWCTLRKMEKTEH